MEVVKSSLGVRFYVIEGEEQATPRQLWEEVFSVLTASDVAGMHVYGGMASSEELALGEPCYICAFTGGRLKQTRRVYRKLEEDAGVNMYLAATHAFLQSNALQKVEGLTYYGKVQRDGALQGGEAELFGVNVCKKRGKRRPVGKGIVFLLAPDSFSDTFPSRQAIKRLTLAARKQFTGVRILPLPIADGGPGTVDALLGACNGAGRTVQIQGPHGEKMQARYAVLRGNTAVIELPEAFAGSPAQGGQDGCSSFGVGELIRRALDEGLGEIIVGLPLSRIDDGGLGCLRALGVKLLDEEGNELAGASADMGNIARIDTEYLHTRVHGTRFFLMTDCVKAPDAAMRDRIRLSEQAVEAEVADKPGAAAAGGLGGALMALLCAERMSCIDALLHAAQFESRIKNVSLVVTGEGRLDESSLAPERAVAGIVSRCAKQKVPVAVIAGQVGPGSDAILELCECSVISAVAAPIAQETAAEKGLAMFDSAANRMFRFIRLGREIERVSARKSKK